MREYETIYILQPDLSAEQITNLQEKFAKAIAKGKGHVLVHSDWGKRKLAYRVKKFRHAHYVYLQYLATGDLITELERVLKYEDAVLKFLTVKLKDRVLVEERIGQPVSPPPPPEEVHSGRSSESHGSRRGVSEPQVKEGMEKKETGEARSGPKSASSSQSEGNQSSSKEEN